MVALSLYKEGLVPRYHLHHVDTPLAAFQAGDEGLVFAQARGEIGLGQASAFASGDEEPNKRHLPRRS